MQPGIFLDRDGVIIENCPQYVRSWEDVHIFPQALQALQLLNHSPYQVIIVTNQSGIGRGVLPREHYESINTRLLGEIKKAGGRIDGVYTCPHRPEEACACRKPHPGLLIQAAHEHAIDLSRSRMIGDAISDLQAGQAAGVRQAALVRTGRGAQQERALLELAGVNFPVFDNLQSAIIDLLDIPQS